MTQKLFSYRDFDMVKYHQKILDKLANKNEEI